MGRQRPNVCVNCPFAQWGPNKERPNCRINYNFLCVRPDAEDLFRISFHGSSLAAVKKMLTQIRRSRRPMFSYVQHWGAEQRSKGRNDFFVLSVGTPDWIQDEDLPFYEEIYDHVMAYGEADVVDLLGGGALIQAGSSDSGNGAAPEETEEEVPF